MSANGPQSTVVAVALPVLSDTLEAIPVVGAWVNSVLDGVAIAVQSMTARTY